jgi:hypothetical protein
MAALVAGGQLAAFAMVWLAVPDLRARAARRSSYAVALAVAAAFAPVVAIWLTGAVPGVAVCVPPAVLGAVWFLPGPFVMMTGGPRPLAAFMVVAGALADSVRYGPPGPGEVARLERELARWTRDAWRPVADDLLESVVARLAGDDERGDAADERLRAHYERMGPEWDSIGADESVVAAMLRVHLGPPAG